jgi:hypothetical protein
VWTEHFNPGMTVMAQPAFEIGKAAFDMLLTKMTATEAEEVEEPGLQLFPAQLRVRGSTAPPQLDQVTSQKQPSHSGGVRKARVETKANRRKESVQPHSHGSIRQQD